MKRYIFYLFILAFSRVAAQDQKLTVLGSSTAAGAGPSNIDSSWVNRTNNYYKTQLGIIDSTYNLAVSGTTCYNAMPDGYTAPGGRPAYDANKNVSKAISFFTTLNSPAKGVVIINFPTNGYDGYSISEIMTSLQTMYNKVVTAGHKCYVATTQPRSDGNFSTSSVKRKLADLKDSIINRFGATYTINFWDGMYNPADTTILAAYSAGDNVHYNNAGHRILFDRVVAKNMFGLNSNDYRSNVSPSGLWSSASSWQVFNGSAWVSAVTPPDTTSGSIHILAGDSISVLTAANMDEVYIHSNAKLAIFNTLIPFTATLKNGPGTDLEIDGRLYVSINSTLSGGGSIQNNSNGLFILRNQGILAVNTTNNGTINVSGTGNVRNATITNNKTFVLIDFTLNLNNSSFINNDSFAVQYNSTSYIASTTALDSGTFTNASTGIIYRSNTAGITNFTSTIKCYNYGKVKGFGEYSFYNTLVNSGVIDPGNNSAATLTVNPFFITGKSPTFLLQVHTSGNVAGTNYDQLKFSTVLTLITNITGATINIIDNANDGAGVTYTLVSSLGTTITGPFLHTYTPGNFNALVYNGNSVTINKSGTGTSWDGGAATTNWGDAANWNPDGVPIATDNLVISSGTLININVNATCKDLVLNKSGLALTILTGNSLTVNGNLSAVLGNININGQSLILNGGMFPVGNGGINGSSSSALTIGGSNGADFGILKMNASPYSSLLNLTINRSGVAGYVSLGSNMLELSGTLTLSNGTLNTGGNLTLMSTASGTARIGAVTNGSISGEVTVQRFIPGGDLHRKWRFLASPVGNVTILNSWQNNIHITGIGTGGTSCPGLTKHSNGFDASATNAGSFYTYSEISNSWSSVANTNATNLETGRGYRIFVRGNRSDGCDLLTVMPTTTSDVTLVAKGTVVTGTLNIPLTLTGANGWNLVGNPYASAIDWGNATWQAMMGAGINRTISIYNPVANVYASWHPIAGGINGGSNIIASGQAFFITVSMADTLHIGEAYKSTDMQTGLFGKSGELNKLKIQLVDTAVLDEAIVYAYDGASGMYENALDGKKGDFGKNRIASFTKNDSTRLAFNAFASDTADACTDTVTLAIGMDTTKSYVLNFIGINSFSRSILLHDRYTGLDISLSDSASYSFTSDASPASTNKNRFYLIFSDTDNHPLPVDLIAFSASKKNATVVLEWKTASEQDNDHFIVERSIDNLSFDEIGNVVHQPAGRNHILAYSFIDEHPVNAATNYYRLKQVDFNTAFQYSRTAVVWMGQAKANISYSIFPNPGAANSPLQISFTEPAKKVSLRLYTSNGDERLNRSYVQTQQITLDEGFKSLDSGVYFLTIEADGQRTTQKVIK
jgi:hypothetical protein